MANANTILGGFYGSGSTRNLFPSPQTVATATETQLVVNTDTGTTQAFIVLPTGGSVYGASSPVDVNANGSITDRSGREYGQPSGETSDQFSLESWNGRPFYIRLYGIGNAGANAGQTLQINLYQGTSTTVATNAHVATTGTGLAAVAGGAFNFYIEAKLAWDNTSQILSGSYTANIAFGTVSQFTAPTAITAVGTTITAAGLSFIPTLKLGNAASSTITLKQFSFDKI